MGKSLTAHGGQNPVEPIIAGKPVVFGPHMENFATLAKALVLKKGAIQVSDMDSLELTIAELLRDSEARKRLVQQSAGSFERASRRNRARSGVDSRTQSHCIATAPCAISNEKSETVRRFALREAMAILILPGFV